MKNDITYPKMHILFKNINDFFFRSISKFITNCNFTSSFSDKINVIIVLILLIRVILIGMLHDKLFILRTQHKLWSFQNGFHPFHNIINHFIIIA